VVAAAGSQLFFYMFFKAVYILILLFTILIDYYSAFYIEKAAAPATKKKLLVTSILANITVLGIFKYFNFLNSNISGIATYLGYTNAIPFLTLLLPIGLSFHTFQAMSYTIEVYRGNQAAEKNIGIFALYIMFYPQLVAGPIERPQQILHQFYEKHAFDMQRVAAGLQRIGWGLFKKIVIADRLALVVNDIYDRPQEFTGVPLILATVFFAFQIYCDFSGYTDIALGCARVMGFRLMENFNQPYSAQTISEFWRRWHISLSSWFRDYVYIPMGGNRKGRFRTFVNLLLVFILCGIWHGANWTFVFWGALHGIYLIVGLGIKPLREKFYSFIKSKALKKGLQATDKLFTFLLVCFAWIFFRAETLNDSFYIITNLFANVPAQISDIITNKNLGREQILYHGSAFIVFFWQIFFIILLIGVQYNKETILWFLKPQNSPFWARWSFYYLLILGILLFGTYQQETFIYFQF
jgi:D-alanyl-lipoteichoic acid acyltransferase DltB (MBOAT superfamily)